MIASRATNNLKNMFTKTKKIAIFSIIICQFLFIIGGTCLPFVAKADDYGLDTAAKNTGLLPKDNEPVNIVGTVISSALSLVGIVFFLLIFYGGIRWMIAQGNEEEVEKAKKTIIAAVIGLIIVMAAYAITAFVGSRLSGSTETTAPTTPPAPTVPAG
jgi:amino acid transporter